ncbi:MAG: ACP S-malonyltransferase [Flavobacteriales bacterium]|jgi:[acyl-carrier-protein] S-malonyltransferase|tara:strand:+ start:1967 stop:2845 length:879 start_codon:yes stop_codon:yes gene_type:complete
MKAFIFPGQGAQFPGMGKNLFDTNIIAKKRFEQANAILGFNITKIMFGENTEALKETKVTQPAIFLHSTILSEVMGERFDPHMLAGHSLGEFSALVSAGVLSFENGLQLVYERALAMQVACNESPGTMAAIIGLKDDVVESICEKTPGIVIAANYNCPGQLVISGTKEAVKKACITFSEAGARRALHLPVGGAFHSPLMEPAKTRLAKAIENSPFNAPNCPIYQNVSAVGTSNPKIIKSNLIAQLTAPVRWTQSIQQMITDGATHFTEVGPGKVLQGLIKKIDRSIETESVD